MSLLILVLSLLLTIEILGIKVVQNRKYVALKVSDDDFVVSVNDKKKWWLILLKDSYIESW